MTLDGIMVGSVSSNILEVNVACVRDKAYLCPRVSYGLLVHVVFRYDVFKVIGRGCTKKGIMFCEFP